MKPACCLIIFLFLFSNVLFSQKSTDSLRRIYNEKLMYRMGSTFRVGTEKFTFKELETEFKISELGLDAFKQAKKYKTIKTVLNFATILSGLAGIAVISNNNTDAAYAFLGGQIVLSMAGGYYHKQYNEWLDRAIWQRNKDLLFPQ